MEKKILGLDLGTTSIGWALVKEATNPQEKSEIIRLGVRVNPLTTDEKDNFSKGADITTNADRTLKRQMRRNLQRYKLRRDHLKQRLLELGWINEDTILAEHTNFSTFETWRLRAKAATEEVSLQELSRILLMINKKRGYKSSRKAKSQEEGEIIDSMDIAKQLYELKCTPGQYSYQLLTEGKKTLPDYYRSDLQNELCEVWETQKNFHPEELTDNLFAEIQGRNEKQTWAILAKPLNLVGVKSDKKGRDLKIEHYKWRVLALTQQLDFERFAVVLQKINGQIRNSSGYLGAISDRSKELYFKNLTVGQYQWAELEADSHHSLKNEVFYRADYMDEFERIWNTQANYHPELTEELKHELRDVIIFYQRPLRSQKGLINFCELEHKQIQVEVDGKLKTKTTGSRVAPKSSPLFQEFKIWQILNNITVSSKENSKNKRPLEEEEKQILANELSFRAKLSKAEALKLLYGNKGKDFDLNYKDIEGNRTMAALYEAYLAIVNLEQPEGKEYKAVDKDIIRSYFEQHHIDTSILSLDTNKGAEEFEKEPVYRLWHLLYSYEGDKSKSGIDSLLQILQNRYGFTLEQARIIAKVQLQDDYGSLSTKAMRNILPYLREGLQYDEACAYAGYRFSAQSMTREELDSRPLKDKLEILPKNSLRNPVVEKIINQMINVVNAVVEKYGKPDEIRIELARDLKKNADERKEMTDAINAETRRQEKYRQILHDEFGLEHVSRTDIIRYKLYMELEANGFKTLYSNTYIPREELFSKRFDIEHIIPQARLFDDSFANKTLELRDVNIEKSNQTARDYVSDKYGADGLAEYEAKIKSLHAQKVLSNTKTKNLLMAEADIPSDFLNRDLGDSAYISKKARELLMELVREVHTTSGKVTDRLREDWQLVDVIQELNYDKYAAIGQTESFKDRDGRTISRISDWSKRNDHRHHAMDALTIAFTRPEFVNYLSNLNARSNKEGNIYAIEKQYLARNEKGKLLFTPPIPLNQFRADAKRQLQNILVSIKAKNKVVTRNVNVTKSKNGNNRTVQLTPRGQLHNETIYGSHIEYVEKKTKSGIERVPQTVYTIRKPVDPNLKIDKVVDARIRQILQDRLAKFGGDTKKAFSNLEENPIYLDKEHGITIKRVTITGRSTVEALHGDKDFVSTANNHHVAIFRDEKGNLQEDIVSFFKATARAAQGLPIIDKEYNNHLGWQFLFSMKQNEYFVFPNEKEGFFPEEVDLMDPDNYSRISPNLYRVQKIATKNYMFRHHLETRVDDENALHRDITWKNIQSTKGLNGIVKVRINHLGEIVAVGEY